MAVVLRLCDVRVSSEVRAFGGNCWSYRGKNWARNNKTNTYVCIIAASYDDCKYEWNEDKKSFRFKNTDLLKTANELTKFCSVQIYI